MADLPDAEHSALYLYGIVPSAGIDGEPLVLAVRGLDDEPITVISAGGIGVLTHACEPIPYEGDVAQVHARVLAQHGVISAAHAAAGTILPIRFNSIVAATTELSAMQVLTAWLERGHDEIEARLEGLRQRVELGVQVTAGAIPAESPAASEPPARGRAYFQAQLAQRKEKENLRATEALGAQAMFDRLAELSDRIVVNPKRPQREGAAPVTGRMLLDVSLLVHPDQVAEIGSYLGEVDALPGMTVRFTGPWAPYAFAGAFDMPLMVQPTDDAATRPGAPDA